MNESMKDHLEVAEQKWREHVKKDFPLRATMKINKDFSASNRDWTFSTDLREINVQMGGDESLQDKFENILTPFWNADADELAEDTIHYLLWHELYHPIEAPFSVRGKDNDNKKIHQAIRRGALRAEPDLSALEQIMKVQLSQNGVKDFILDNRFYLDNKEKQYVREDILPTWDVLELQQGEARDDFFTITRYLYGALYGPESTYEFFEQRLGENGKKVGAQALEDLIQQEPELPDVIKLKAREDDEPGYDSTQTAQNIRSVFVGEDRYQGIQRLMSVLGPYVQQGMPTMGMEDISMEGSGGMPSTILEDLLEDMEEDEMNDFLEDLGNESEHALDELADQLPQEVRDQVRNLDLLAAHNFYKNNHPDIRLKGTNTQAVRYQSGIKHYFELQSSRRLREDQLDKLNIQEIQEIQKKTRLPWLIELGEGMYQYNEYKLREKRVHTKGYEDKNLEVPDITEFYLDSSGSMFSGDFRHDDGSKMDMLSHVMYGFADALSQAGKKLGKQTKMQIHNFGERQIDSKIVPVDEFLGGDLGMLKTLWKPNNGYGHEDLDITVHQDTKKRTYVVVTDGQLVLSGRSEREAEKLDEIAKNPNYQAVLFEIGDTYELGRIVQQNPDIAYCQVHDKDEMIQAGLEVLLGR